MTQDPYHYPDQQAQQQAHGTTSASGAPDPYGSVPISAQGGPTSAHPQGGHVAGPASAPQSAPPGAPQPAPYGAQQGSPYGAQPSHGPWVVQTIALTPQDPIFSTPEGYPTTASNDGRIAWAMGLIGASGIVLIWVLPIHTFVMGLVMLIVGLIQRGKNPVARAVGTRAAIFGGISTVLSIVPIIAFILTVIGFASTAENQSTADTILGIGFLGTALLSLFVLVLVPLVGTIMGIVGLVRPVPRDQAARILAR